MFQKRHVSLNHCNPSKLPYFNGYLASMAWHSLENTSRFTRIATTNLNESVLVGIFLQCSLLPYCCKNLRDDAATFGMLCLTVFLSILNQMDFVDIRRDLMRPFSYCPWKSFAKILPSAWIRFKGVEGVKTERYCIAERCICRPNRGGNSAWSTS